MANKNKTITKLFARFLKENRAFIGFIRALKNRNNNENTQIACSITTNYFKHGFRGDFMGKTFLNLTRLSGQLIDKSFIWDRTIEGHRFWYQLYLYLCENDLRLDGSNAPNKFKVD